MSKEESKVRDVLNYYSKKFGTMKVGTIIYDKFWTHFNFPSSRYNEFFGTCREEATDRYIFPHEVVIETDLPTKKANEKAAKIIEKGLKGYEYIKWWSGNKSFHFHIFFEDLYTYILKRTLTKNIQDIYKEPNKHPKLYSELKLIKELFIRHIIGCTRKLHSCDNCNQLFNDGTRCPIYKLNMDMQMCNKHMIRLEYAYNNKSGKFKTLVDNDTEDELKAIHHNVNSNNQLPSYVWNKLQHIEDVMDKAVVFPEVKISNNMDCIKHILNNKLKDSRKRSAFILAEVLSKSIKDKASLASVLFNWNKLQGMPLNVAQLRHIVKKSGRYSVGCRYIKNNVLLPLNMDKICGGCYYGKHR